jgi:UPF0176 protein
MVRLRQNPLYMSQHSAFYQFVPLPDVAAVIARLRVLTTGLHGSIIVAGEGINGAVAGAQEVVDAFERAMHKDAHLGAYFAGMSFKRTRYVTPPFGRMKISHRPRIVAVNVPAVSQDTRLQRTALSPEDWRAFIQRKDVVVLDNRNAFEYALGHFRNAQDPDVTHFKDFPAYVQAHAEAWRAQGKTVAMYCTGGIRCERTNAWVQSLDLPCVELEGGILNYFQHVPDAAQDWQGECYVFDNRVALDTRGNETATTAEDVFANAPEEAWRLARAKRLDDAAPE